jgi:ABC-2 type transport system permease protein
MRILRLMAYTYVMNLKLLSNSLFFVLTSTIQPVIFATVAFYMFRAGQRPGTLLYAALGAGLMGVWSSTLFGSGGAIQWQRWQGTLELLIAAPAPFIVSMVPLTLGTASIGVYSILATLFWGRVFFGVPLHLAHPIAFAASLPATLIGLGLLGLVLASTFVLYRQATAFSNLLEYPVWLVTGLLVPLALLPGWVAPIGWSLAPYWGMRAIRGAALGGDPWLPIGMCLLLGAVYLTIGALTMANFERLARKHATLSLT